MVVANFVAYISFKDAVDALSSQRNKAIILASTTFETFTVAATFNNDIVLRLYLSNEPTTFIHDFPQVIRTNNILSQ